MIYSGTKREDMISYNIPNNMLRSFETKSLFLKENRLQVVSEWDPANWQEIFDSIKVDWCLVTGVCITTGGSSCRHRYPTRLDTVVRFRRPHGTQYLTMSHGIS